MKNIILILLLSFSLTINAQKKCITVKVEKIENYRVKVITTDTCKKVITVKTMLKKEWDSLQKKRKSRKTKK
jgi:hypothetical protein|tara:strand:+ start:923 stop:1138 length:216 start_codon:yes stop_codon:yes gene_type:complete